MIPWLGVSEFSVAATRKLLLHADTFKVANKSVTSTQKCYRDIHVPEKS